jgi:hypothetical protein
MGTLASLLEVTGAMGTGPAVPARHRFSATLVAQPRTSSEHPGERQV